MAPTPQELEQQTECTGCRAKDKRSETVIVATAAPPSFDPSVFRQAAREGRMWWRSTLLCYIKGLNAAQHNAMYRSKAARSLTLQPANIFRPPSLQSGDKEPQALAGDKWN